MPVVPLAVNVLLLPAQILVAEAATLTVGAVPGLTVIVAKLCELHPLVVPVTV